MSLRFPVFADHSAWSSVIHSHPWNPRGPRIVPRLGRRRDPRSPPWTPHQEPPPPWWLSLRMSSTTALRSATSLTDSRRAIVGLWWSAGLRDPVGTLG